MEPLDPRARRIAELESQLAAAPGVIDKLNAQVAVLTTRGHELEARRTEHGWRNQT